MKTENLKIKIAGLILLASFSTLSADAQQTRNVGDFSGIKVGESFNIIISQADANTVVIDADEKTQSQIKTEVKDGILVITENGAKIDKPVKIGIKSLQSLYVSGSCDVKSENQLICDKLSIETSGAGDVHLDVKASEIKTHLSGAGDVTLKGTAQLIDADISGAGNLKASNLLVDKAKIKVSGAGDGKVNATQSLDADVSGAGSIIYKGKPIERNINISGAGSVRESKSGNGEETASDTTKLKFGKKKYVIIGDGENDDDGGFVSEKDSLHNFNEGFKHWAGIEVGVNGLLDYKNTLDAPSGATYLELDYAKSIQFGLNLFQKNFHIYKNYINLVTGFGFDFNHYALKNDVTLSSNVAFMNATVDSVKYNKNTLNISYIKIPLMLEFNTSKNSKNNFHIAVGAELEYRIHSVLKQKYDLNDQHYKLKQRDAFNLAPFLYTATARIGYNNITVFATYALNGLFQEEKGPQEYPFIAGVNFSF